MSKQTEVAYIGLGSNLDDPIQQVQTAFNELAALPEVEMMAQSGLYRSAPVGPADQPDYINAVACIRTTLPAEALLDALQGLEQVHHRRRIRHWGPRTLDLDLLLFGEHTIRSERLIVPHPELTKRQFVLQPLMEIAPDLVIVESGPVKRLLAQCPHMDLERF
ncbi:MAG: 2-amino-4-hydroxy-6-hydroxymethyldihydropteridine diphosphokinase [Pseudomonadota bacterium]